MSEVILEKPKKVEDFAYKAHVMSDPLSMSYNAGYNIERDNYHYDTGVIDYPENRWGKEYLRNYTSDYYFAYIKDVDKNCYVGYCCYYLENGQYQCGIVIESKYRHQGYGRKGLELLIQKAKENEKIKSLYDCFEVDRGCLNLFLSLGFEIVERTKWQKFSKEVDGVVVKLDFY